MSDRLSEYEKHPIWKKFLYAAAFVCLMLAGFLMVFSMRNKPDPNRSPLGNITPQILVGDTVYYWSGTVQELTGTQTNTNRISPPEGFHEYGGFLATVDTPPTEDLQMQAEFSAFGTVYRNPDAPEVIYILMTTDWFNDTYVRFASRDIFDGDRIAWNGQQYCVPFRKGIDTPLEALPETAVSIGALHFIGLDYIPQKDLETNCIGDDHGHSLEGREAFYDTNNPDVIYIYAMDYSSDGSKGVYWECPIWEESYLLKNVK